MAFREAEGRGAGAGWWKPLGWFVILLLLAVGLAGWYPEGGAGRRGEWLAAGAAGLIFFIQGLQMPWGEVRRGIRAWPAHLFCQAWMFGVYPLLGWLVLRWWGGGLSAPERVGVMYLCVLPTTIATNAAFCARAGGQTAVAMVNIVAGNLLGVWVAPLALAALLGQTTGAAISWEPLVKAVAGQLILPFIAGQILRRWLAGLAERWRGVLREVATVLVMLIVYRAGCDFWVAESRPEISWELVGVTLSLLVVGKGLCWATLCRMHWPPEWRVAVFYAATQKTLAAGLPMAAAVLAGIPGQVAPPLAVVALPLVVFHLGQLIVGALLVPVLAMRGKK